jgi:hypothetical protein
MSFAFSVYEIGGSQTRVFAHFPEIKSKLLKLNLSNSIFKNLRLLGFVVEIKIICIDITHERAM